jgi:hypothetical protein
MAEASAWIRMMKTRKGPGDMTFSPVEVGSDVFSEGYKATFGRADKM